MEMMTDHQPMREGKAETRTQSVEPMRLPCCCLYNLLLLFCQFRQFFSNRAVLFKAQNLAF